MIYKIRIILDAEEDIFRDVEIESHFSLEEFHNTITQAFGFLGNEMASFFTCDADWVQDEEIPLFDMGDPDGGIRLMAQTKLSDVMTKESPKLIYVYDFLNMWTFFVELADVVMEEPGRIYPNLLFSFGELPESPPEKRFQSDAVDNPFGIDDTLDSYEDLDFDENWN
ncbi:MAG: hypothetical protein AB3N16_13895 [Flavobacteriaceae bacterium]